jgi:Fe-S cluster assembly protein SufB/Fe-S cluster assembly protein SufD
LEAHIPGREPDWLTRFRVRALESYFNLPIESSPLYIKHIEVGRINFDELVATPARAPHRDPKVLADRLGEGLSIIQIGPQVFTPSLPPELRDSGILILDLMTAIREHEELVRPYLVAGSIEPSEDKLTALNLGLARTGIFIYIPAYVQLSLPIRLLEVAGEGALFSRLIVVVAEGGVVNLVEEGYSDGDGRAVRGRVVELYLEKGAEATFTQVHGFGAGCIALNTHRANLGENSRMRWISVNFSSGLVRNRDSTTFTGYGGYGEDLRIVLGRGDSRFDNTNDLLFRSRGGVGEASSRLVIRDRSGAVSKGMIRIGKEAKNSEAYLAIHSMLMGKEARAQSIPGLEIEVNDVRATHSASVAQLDEEQVFYLMSRGLRRDAAEKLVALGFFEPLLDRIPSKDVVNGVHRLLDAVWEGRRPRWPIRIKRSRKAARVEEVVEEEMRTHYKYRRS